MNSYLPPRIAVTGATGFLGSHLIPQLLKNKVDVTCLVRSSSDTSKLPKEVKIATVDLASGAGLEEALRGQTAFIHMAALLFGLRWQDYLQANTCAAQNICKALKNLNVDGPQKILLVSSQAASGPSKGCTPLLDDCKPAPVSAYGWSKLLVERNFQSANFKNLVILRPSIIYGSGDRGLLPLFQGIKHGLAVSPGFKRDFPVSIVHAYDMSQAILLGLRPEAHGIYHVSDGLTYTMEQFCQKIGQALGQKHTHVFKIPLPIMHLTAFLSTQSFCLLNLFRTERRAPNWNLDKYLEAKQAGWVLRPVRMQQELGYEPKYSLELGAQESIKGYQELGWL